MKIMATASERELLQTEASSPAVDMTSDRTTGSKRTNDDVNWSPEDEEEDEDDQPTEPKIPKRGVRHF